MMVSVSYTQSSLFKTDTLQADTLRLIGNISK